MKIKSNLQPREYTINEVYRIINPEQAKRFMKHRCFPIDIYPSLNEKKEDIIVYVFLKEEAGELKRLWDNYELD
jgi:hypothetical protein